MRCKPVNNLLYTLLLLLISAVRIQAAERPDLRFRHLSIEQGLSQSSVNAILQDKEGYLWFGTQDGLNRYDGFKFTVYKNDQEDSTSISNGHIRALLEDEDGTIWVGTESGGLNAFYKKKGIFKRYLHNASDNTSLSNNHVRCLYNDSEGMLWVGTTGGGINVFNKKTGNFIHFNGKLPDGANTGRVMVESIHEDGLGKIWVGTTKDGVLVYDKKNHTWKQFLHGKTADSQLSTSRVSTLCKGNYNTMWVGTYGGGLLLLDAVTGNILKHFYNKLSDVYSISNNHIVSLYNDNQGIVWIGTYGSGLAMYDIQKELFFGYANDADDNYSISNNDVWSIYKDREGVMWFGTDGGGVNIYDKVSQKFIFYRNHPKLPSISNNIVRCMFQDSKGILWVGTYGGGLNAFDKNKNSYVTYKHDDKNKHSISNDRVVSILEDKDGILWFGTDGGGLNRFDRKTNKFKSYQHNPGIAGTLSNNVIWCMSLDAEGHIWVGTRGGGLNLFDKDNGTFSIFRHSPNDINSIGHDFVRVIYDDRKGNLWIGTDGGGFSVMNKKTHHFRTYKSHKNDKHGLNHNIVRTIYIDNKDRVWIGTDGGGLNLFDHGAGKFYHFTEKDGLPNNVVYGILSDSKDYLWMSTNNGLCKFKLMGEPTQRKLEIRNYDISDGLQSNEFNTGAYYKSPEGTMYFGGINGFNKFQPDSVKDNTYQPPIQLTDFKVFEKTYELDTLIQFKKEIVLNYTQNFFSFGFSALSFSMPDKNKYAYQMVGFDNDWVNVGNRHFASYTNLDPGKYTFRVKGSNNDGVWNENGIEISVVIQPPFYKTWWFYMFSGLFVVLTTIGLVKMRERALRHEKIVLERMVASRTQEVVKQKDEILLKNTELSKQQREITDSINYARRIQQAILPLKNEVKDGLSDSFVLYTPKDIVSGDFYWYKKVNSDTVLIAAADCTGHGVPGAFMSMIGVDKLNETENKTTVPGEIIGNLNYAIKTALRQSTIESENRDGMDIVLCRINTTTRVLDYAGANRPLWIFRNQEADSEPEVIEPNKCAVGGYTGENQVFVNHTIQLHEGDCVYLFTDGFVDQFGGDKGKKLMSKNFKNMLKALQKLPMEMQGEYLQKQFKAWQGDYEQVDDILVIGIRV